MRYAYPLMLDVAERLAVVVGGGPVAARKINGLLAAGARRIRVVAPDFHPTLPAEAERLQALYRSSHLDGADLAFAATNVPGVNEQVVRDARERGILVNRADADDADPGDFTTPARFQRGGVTVAVSAGSPTLSARIRDRLYEAIQPAWLAMAEILQELRPKLRDTAGLSEAQRAEVLRELASSEALQAAEQGTAAVWNWLATRYPHLAHLEERQAGLADRRRELAD